MEELKKFIQLLWRNRLIIITVPLITVMVTSFIVRKMPFMYAAQTQIATGIVDETQQMSIADVGGFIQDSRVTQKFTNLVETMRSKNLIDLVSYRLILHDLTSKPFNPYSPIFKYLNKDAIKHAIEVYTDKYNKHEPLNLRDPDQAGLNKVLQDIGYDEYSIRSGLTIGRLGASDFISVYYESPSSEQSAFVVNVLTDEFIDDYRRLVKEGQVSMVVFLKNLIQVKSDTLAQRVNALRKYKIDNRILNLEEQSSQLLTESGTYEAQEQDAERDIAALNGTIANIDKKFDPKDQSHIESTLIGPNQEFLSIRDQMNSLVKKYEQSDFDEQYRNSMDSLGKLATAQIGIINSNQAVNPLTTLQDLIQQKAALEIRRDQILFGLGPVKKHINEIKNKFTSLVPHEAAIQSLQRDIDIVSKEYQDLLAEYNKTNLQSELPVKLRKVQVAMPGYPLPSKKMLLVILSGIASGTFCLLTFFVIFYLDDKIRKPAELAAATRAPVLGYLNLVGRSTLDLKGIWKNLHGTPEMMEFKKQLRSTRFEVNRELTRTSNKGQMLSITSLGEDEGKTLIAACIAYTYVMVNKKVLLIDGNFDHPSITQNSNTQLFLEDYLKTGEISGVDFNSGIMVMGNHGGDSSLLEVCDEKTIVNRFEQLRSKFDVILVETPSLDSLNKAKEWILFTDKTLSVFEANQALNEHKKQHLHYLSSINGHFIGWILNKVQPEGRVPERLHRATVID